MLHEMKASGRDERMMQSRIKDVEVKTLERRAVEERWGRKKRGGLAAVEFKGLSQLFL